MVRDDHPVRVVRRRIASKDQRCRSSMPDRAAPVHAVPFASSTRAAASSRTAGSAVETRRLSPSSSPARFFGGSTILGGSTMLSRRLAHAPTIHPSRHTPHCLFREDTFLLRSMVGLLRRMDFTADAASSQSNRRRPVPTGPSQPAPCSRPPSPQANICRDHGLAQAFNRRPDRWPSRPPRPTGDDGAHPLAGSLAGNRRRLTSPRRG